MGNVLERSAGTWVEAEPEACEVHCVEADKVARGRELLLDDEVYAHLAETFRALADPSRAKILYSLLHQELCTCDLAAITRLSEPGVSQHLRVLRNLRLVKSRRAGKLVFYSLDDGHVRVLLSLSLNHLRHGPTLPEGPDGGVAGRREREISSVPLSRRRGGQGVGR